MSQSLRVLHVAPYFEEAWAYGGIPRVVSRLARGTARRGHRVSVFTTDAMGPHQQLRPEPPHDPKEPWSKAPGRDEDGLELTVFPNRFPSMAHRHQFFTPRGLRARIRSKSSEIDLAHLHACHNLPVAWAAKLLRKAGVPYILHPNGTGPRIESRLWSKWLFDIAMARGLFPGAAAVLAVSRAERQQLERLGVPDESIRQLPNPLDLTEVEPPPPPGELRKHWPGGGRTLVYLGQLTRRKGLATLISALREAPEDVRLAIFGADRGVLPGLKRLASELDLDQRVAFLGCIGGASRFSVLAEADLVVYASRHEVFGLSAFEALLVGTPVIVGNDSGCGELVGRFGGGLQVPPGEVEPLARAMHTILQEPERFRRLASEAGLRVRKELGNETVCRQLESIYETVLESSKRGRDA